MINYSDIHHVSALIINHLQINLEPVELQGQYND